MSGARRRAREHALQVLFALDAQAEDAGDGEARVEVVDRALDGFFQGLAHGAQDEAGEEPDARDAREVREFAEMLVRGVATHREELDQLLTAASRNWRVERMARVDRNILRLGIYELKHQPETPARVVINEAIEVAKRYGATESPAFVNGVLDRAATELGRT